MYQNKEGFMNKEQIDLNVQKAIDSMNSTYSFTQSKVFIEEALRNTDGYKTIAYYDVLNRISAGVCFNVRGLANKKKVKENFTQLFEYISDKFASIVYLDIDADSEEECGVVNDICCTVVQNASHIINVLIQTQTTILFVTTMISLVNYKKQVMSILLTLEKTSAEILSRYHTQNETVKENIKMWNEEVAKYGKKYL